MSGNILLELLTPTVSSFKEQLGSFMKMSTWKNSKERRFMRCRDSRVVVISDGGGGVVVHKLVAFHRRRQPRRRR